jgi:hypothetical protein
MTGTSWNGPLEYWTTPVFGQSLLWKICSVFLNNLARSWLTTAHAVPSPCSCIKISLAKLNRILFRFQELDRRFKANNGPILLIRTLSQVCRMSVTALAVPQPRSSPVKTGSNPSSDSSLREVCLTHLNLIHKMSETILEKDRQIKVLKENNSQVKV